MASNLRMGVSGAPISAQVIAAGSFIDIDITGASAITEVADTLSSTATLALFGAASITEAADTLAALVSVPIRAMAAITEQADTATAASVRSLRKVLRVLPREGIASPAKCLKVARTHRSRGPLGSSSLGGKAVMVMPPGDLRPRIFIRSADRGSARSPRLRNSEARRKGVAFILRTERLR